MARTSGRRPPAAVVLVGGFGLAAVVAITLELPAAVLAVALAACAACALLWLRDPAALVTVYVCCLLLLPVRMIFGPLGSLGQPATIVAVGCFVAWCLGRARPSPERGLVRMGPLGLALGLFVVAMLIGYLAGQVRLLTYVEGRTTDYALVLTLGYVGLAVLTAEAIRTRQAVNRLVDVLVLGGAFMALVGIVEFNLRVLPESYLLLPGFTMQDAVVDVSRADFSRATSTAAHPIEFGVVVAQILPFAVTRAMTTARASWPYWLAVALMVASMPTTISRSTVLCLAVGIGLLALTWTWRQRLNLAVAAVVGLLALRAVFPGVLGTILALFLFLDEDPSISGRTGDFDSVAALVSESPLIGRGLGTFDPRVYFFLDNQFFGFLIETGVLGALAATILLLVGMGLGRGTYRRSPDPGMRALGQAAAASTAVVLASWVTFDGYGFRVTTGIAFVVLGLASAMWRLEAERRPWVTVGDRWSNTAPSNPLPGASGAEPVPR